MRGSPEREMTFSGMLRSAAQEGPRVICAIMWNTASACPGYRLHEPEKWRRARAPTALRAAPDCVGIVDLPILAPAGPRGAYS